MNKEHYRQEVTKIAEVIGDSEIYRLENSLEWDISAYNALDLVRTSRKELEHGVTLLRLLESKLTAVNEEGGFSPVPELPVPMMELFGAVKIGYELRDMVYELRGTEEEKMQYESLDGTYGRIMMILNDYQLEKTDLRKLIKRTDDIVMPRLTAFLENFTDNPNYKDYLSKAMEDYTAWQSHDILKMAVM